MEKILNLLQLEGNERELFEQAARGHEQLFAEQGVFEDGSLLSDEDWRTATVILGIANTGVLKRYPEHCRFLQGKMAGPDAFLKPGILPEGCMIAGCQGAYGQSVSEHMFAMAWGIMKLLPQYRDNQFSAVWTDLGKCRTMKGMKILVFGTGDLGTAFARLCRPFETELWGVRRNSRIPVSAFDHTIGFEDAEALLPEMDLVINLAPAGPLTDGYMTKERFLSMKPDAIFLNGGRGSFVSSDVLAEVLSEGHLFGAGVDVTDREPLPAEHPLWQCRNCLITPHKAGFDKIPVTYRNVARICLDNLKRYLNGEEVKNRIR